MMKLVDILGLGSSSFLKRVRVQVPFLAGVIKKMPTINQLCRSKRKKKQIQNKVPALNSCPQKKGVCLKWHCCMFGLGVHIGLGQRLRSVEHDEVVGVPI